MNSERGSVIAVRYVVGVSHAIVHIESLPRVFSRMSASVVTFFLPPALLDFLPAPSRKLHCRVPRARPRQFSRRRSPPRRGDHRRSASMPLSLRAVQALAREAPGRSLGANAAPLLTPSLPLASRRLHSAAGKAPCPSAPLRRRPPRAPLRSALNNKRAHCQIAAPARRSR